MKTLLLLACLVLFAAHPAFAETRSIGYSTWSVTGGTVRVLYMLPEAEAKHLGAPGSPVLTTTRVADYVLAHLSVIRQNAACPAADQGQGIGPINTLALMPGLLRFEIIFQCKDGMGLVLSNTAFADRVADHVEFARVQIDHGGFVQHVFTAGAPRWALPVSAAMLRSDSWARYATIGAAHVSRSAYVVCFVLALLLIARDRRLMLTALGALTAGYCASVMLAVFDIAAPRFADGPAFGGLLVFLAAATSVALSLSDPRRGAKALGAAVLVMAVPAFIVHGAPAAFAALGAGILAVSVLYLPKGEDQRGAFLLAAAFLFALLDGFTLSTDLGILALPPASLAPMLLGFNAGALGAALVLPLCVVAAWRLVPMARRMAAPGGFLPDLTASVFIACGVFWFSTWLYR